MTPAAVFPQAERRCPDPCCAMPPFDRQSNSGPAQSGLVRVKSGILFSAGPTGWRPGPPCVRASHGYFVRKCESNTSTHFFAKHFFAIHLPAPAPEAARYVLVPCVPFLLLLVLDRKSV